MSHEYLQDRGQGKAVEGSGRSRKGSDRPMKGSGKVSKNVKERQLERSRKGMWKGKSEGQGKAVGKQ